VPVKTCLEAIREKIISACLKAGRAPDGVQLVAATKTIGADRIVEAIEAGVKIAGENRVQEALPKIEELRKRGVPCEWHFIGKLQRNKVKHAVGLFSLIHSVDSLPLAEEISRFAERAEIVQNVLIEVNVSGEPSKKGFRLQEALSAVDRIRELKYVKLKGLMTIPPLSSNSEDSRPFFKELHRLGNYMATRTGLNLEIYSMGMSSDFEVAVEEGATHLRIGTALFGERGK